MGPVKKSHKPKSHRYRTTLKRAPRLVDILPNQGFIWRTGRGKSLLKSPQCRAIMKTLLRHSPTEPRAIKIISVLFKKATAQIKAHADKPAPEFWEMIGAQLHWTKGLSGELIYAFSLVVISARAKVHDFALNLVEMDKVEEANHLRSNTIMTAAVDDFTKIIMLGYKDLKNAEHRAIRNKFNPPWTRDEHNEGDEESTCASFLKAVEEARVLNEKRALNEMDDEEMVDVDHDSDNHYETDSDDDDDGLHDSDSHDAMDEDDENDEDDGAQSTPGPSVMPTFTMALPLRPR
ncbi:hypothetical protein F4779DRAFT_643322 [Xylariaceae sp. FL0662B]|nr:hypothetical protein F4779DRAFT_643322 [Xylariaceae sp. FL0662B]